MRRPRFAVLATTVALLSGTALAACDTDDGRTMREPTASERAAMPTTTTSTIPGVPIASDPPDLLTPTSTSTVLTSSSTSPSTTAPGSGPAGSDGGVPFTVSGPWAMGAAIPAEHTCDGADTAPVISWTAPPAGTVEVAVVVTDRDAENFVHYAAAGLPPTAGGLGGAAVPGAVEGSNDFGTTGWSGPCPPAGTTHTYVWTVYALAEPSGFAADGSGRAWWAQLVESAAFASAEYTGAYTRAA